MLYDSAVVSGESACWLLTEMFCCERGRVIPQEVEGEHVRF
jgi:hypothetical protein